MLPYGSTLFLFTISALFCTTMKSRIFISAVTVLLGSIFVLSSASKNMAATLTLSDNQKLVTKALVSELIQNLEKYRESSLSIELIPNNSQVLNQLQTSLYADGFKILRESRDTSFRVEIEFNQSNNTLTQISRRNFTRSIDVKADVFVLGADGTILNAFDFQFVYTDTLTKDQIIGLETEWEITTFDYVDKRGFMTTIRRLGEPILITTAVATTIYLLYNVRSQ